MQSVGHKWLYTNSEGRHHVNSHRSHTTSLPVGKFYGSVVLEAGHLEEFRGFMYAQWQRVIRFTDCVRYAIWLPGTLPLNACKAFRFGLFIAAESGR